jgi:hypothetical protein
LFARHKELAVTPYPHQVMPVEVHLLTNFRLQAFLLD